MKLYPFSLLLASLCMIQPAAAEVPHKKEISAFHSALAPLWHASPGKARAASACGQMENLIRLAQDIKLERAKALQEALEVMQEKCKTNPDEADVVFGKVHDAFHHLGEK